MRFPNPFGFRPGPVTFWTTAIYLAVTIPLIYVHETVPPAPSAHSLAKQGLNLSEAWDDLQVITKQYHPFNSKANADVRRYLIERSTAILDRNGVPHETDPSGGVIWNPSIERNTFTNNNDDFRVVGSAKRPRGATIFDDRTSNVTWTVDSLLRSAKSGAQTWQGYYFEGDNFYVYIHGEEDPEGEWWKSQNDAQHNPGGVLVNCHFDSVSTGYGATDDGMSCVSMLQLLSYFTTEGRQPKHGIVLLFNNAEEDGLLGARAFGYSPLLKFCHTFVNLEGAGAGGRAMLFRTTDLQAAEAYAKSPHPFGSVVAANAFERGVIKSGTDFEVFAPAFGQRGLDIAFYEPRSRYHTEDDDSRHTSVRSIWHMLSAALASTERLSEITGTVFNGDRADGDDSLVQNGKPTEGVYFDWYGSGWLAFPLRGLFAWSLTLLVVTPVVLCIVTYLLVRQDKYYYFAMDIWRHSEIHDEPVAINGWRGFFRYPLALIFAIGLTIASILLVAKVNPLIVYSSGYAVWAMTVSLFYFSFWLIMRGANFVRPTALHRGFALVWLFILSWVLQVFAALIEDRIHLGGLYFAAFFHSAIFLALFISLLELFVLPGKHEFANRYQDDAAPEHVRIITSSDNTITGEEEEEEEEEEEGAEYSAENATETTPLRAGESGYGSNEQTTFASTYRRTAQADESPAPPPVKSYAPYEHEQAWSGRLPTWTWFIQFLLLAPVHVIIVGNLGLIQTSSMNMTGADGGGLLAPLMGIGIMTILLLLPLTPFMHRITRHVPLFLLVVLIVTFIYNLVAFPFSTNYRYKLYFQEVIDVDAGTDIVSLSGLAEYAQAVVSSIPSAANQYNCSEQSSRAGLTACKYAVSSLSPHLVDGKKPKEFITVTGSLSLDGRTANLQIEAADSKMCILELSRPVYGFKLDKGLALDERFGSSPQNGMKRITLFRREWEGPWDVELQLTRDIHETDPKAFDVTVGCAYSDMNDARTIPVLRELYQYMPKWAVISKAAVGLVEFVVMQWVSTLNVPPSLAIQLGIYGKTIETSTAAFTMSKPPVISLLAKPRPRDAQKHALLYFICGNPGLVNFYVTFLECLRGMLDAADEGTVYDIYGRNLLGFCDGDHEPFDSGGDGPWDLEGQIEAIYEDVAARRAGEEGSRPYDFVVLMGHSVGAYISVEIMHRHMKKQQQQQQDSRAPHLHLRHGFLLFPTLTHIASSPSGRRVGLLTRLPGLEANAHRLAKLVLACIPYACVLWIVANVMGFTRQTAEVTARWLKSRDGVWQAVHLGISEMGTICEEKWEEELWAATGRSEGEEEGLLKVPRFFIFYGRNDHWVANHLRDAFIERRREGEGHTRILVDEGDIPHAFCVREHTSWLVAKKVFGWVREIEGQEER